MFEQLWRIMSCKLCKTNKFELVLSEDHKATQLNSFVTSSAVLDSQAGWSLQQHWVDALRIEGSCLSRLSPCNNIGMDERGTFFNMTILSFAFVLCTFALVPVTSLNLSHVTPESFISIMIWEPCSFPFAGSLWHGRWISRCMGLMWSRCNQTLPV
jgi:hypothetical protein